MYKDLRKRTEYFRKRRKERINFLREYKEDKCCAICGWREHPEILLFHHIDPSTKSFDFSGSEVGNLSFNKIKAEIDKCILLCLTVINGIIIKNLEFNMYTITQKSYSNREVYYITDNKSFKFALYKYHKDKHIIFLSSVFVEEPYRKQGIGNKILNEAEIIAKQYNADLILLQCKRQSWVRKWYIRHGYVFHSKNREYDWMQKSI